MYEKGCRVRDGIIGMQEAGISTPSYSQSSNGIIDKDRNSMPGIQLFIMGLRAWIDYLNLILAYGMGGKAAETGLVRSCVACRG